MTQINTDIVILLKNTSLLFLQYRLRTKVRLIFTDWSPGSITKRNVPLFLSALQLRDAVFPSHCQRKQADGCRRKACEKEPETPYERLMESPDVSEERKARLKRGKDGQNPVELNRCLNKAVGRLLKLNRKGEDARKN
jgi:hypothetical protein